MEDTSYYLAYDSLLSGAPALFFRESYNPDAYDGKVDDFEKWKAISNCNYYEPQKRKAKCDNKEVDVLIPLVPTRAKSKSGYIREFQDVHDAQMKRRRTEHCMTQYKKYTKNTFMSKQNIHAS